RRFGSIDSGEWYYLRATMRDASGGDGIIDSYDFHVFRDSAGTDLVDSRLGISFRNGYQGGITHIALRSFEQQDHTATVLFDQISTNRSVSDAPVARPADFGHQWVRNNPFMIFARGA